MPFSHPELFGHWLNMWAASRHLDVRFEVLNAGRESVISTDIAAIVRTRCCRSTPTSSCTTKASTVPAASVVEKMPDQSAAPPPRTQAATSPAWLRAASRYSALMGRVLSAVGRCLFDLDGNEWPKPDYKAVWPAGLDERDPTSPIRTCQ